MKPGRLKVSIIGAGKVGAVLGAALRAAEHQVVAVTAVSDASRERAELLLPGVPILPLDEAVRAGDLVVFAVPDDVLPDLVTGLVGAGPGGAAHIRPGQILLHTSGRHGLSVFDPARHLGVVPLAVHPAMTFTGFSLDLTRLTDTVFGVTAPAVYLPIAQALAVEMGGEPVVIDDADRAAYHSALAHASNHLVTLVAQSSQVLGGIGVEDPAAMLGPLMRASLDNALSAGEYALTGPVARGDAATVEAHLAALRAAGLDDVLAAYRAMALATAQRAERAGRLTPSVAARLVDLLND
jgi:predicted short-subunit dehydrogenase-like oxidoreductase (DUF2520 family)